MAYIMRTEGVPGTSSPVEDLSNRGHVATTDEAPSMELSLAIAALRRGLDASAVDCTDIAELERCRELTAALAGLEETYMASGAGSFDLTGTVTAAAAAKDEHAGRQLRRVCRYATMLTAVVAPEHIGDPQSSDDRYSSQSPPSETPFRSSMLTMSDGTGRATRVALLVMKSHSELGSWRSVIPSTL